MRCTNATWLGRKPKPNSESSKTVVYLPPVLSSLSGSLQDHGFRARIKDREQTGLPASKHLTSFFNASFSFTGETALACVHESLLTAKQFLVWQHTLRAGVQECCSLWSAISAADISLKSHHYSYGWAKCCHTFSPAEITVPCSESLN